MFSSATKLERGVENVARKIGIDPKVASKTWNTMSTKFSQSRSKLMKRSNSEAPDKYTYQRIPSMSHTKLNINSIPIKSNINPKNQTSFVKYASYCIIFFACIILLNFLFTKHLNQTKHTNISPNDDIYFININTNLTHSNENNDKQIHINYDEGLPALMDNDNKDHSSEINELFNKISNKTKSNENKNENDISIPKLPLDENPMLEENSMKQLRDNIDLNQHLIQTDHDLTHSMNSQSVFDLKEHKYNPYPLGLSDIKNGIYYLSMVSDMDKASKYDKYKWRSYVQHAKLTFHKMEKQKITSADADSHYEIDIEWIAPPFDYDENIKLINETCCNTVVLEGYFNEKGRGMELSELLRFNNKLYAFDDRTGIVYEISKQFETIPRYILMEGNGDISKGMKIEWATYKHDEELVYIGSIGREYTNSDGTKIRKLGLLWVVTLDKNGIVEHVDWTERYMKIREVTATLFPGYLWIESVEWSQIHKKWFIAPRYVSFDKYDSKLTENRGCNLLIIASEDFSNIELVWIKFNSVKATQNERRLLEGDEQNNFGYKSMNDLTTAELRSMSVRQENMKSEMQHLNKGFSSIRFLPNTNDTIIIAIRTQESDKDIVGSYISIFDIGGNVYLDSKRIPLRKKYEGLVVL